MQGKWLLLPLLAAAALPCNPVHAAPVDSPRQEFLVSKDAPWEYLGAKTAAELPGLGTPEYKTAAWSAVTLPHVFTTRLDMNGVHHAWYRTSYTVPPELGKARCLYLVFEGVSAVADVYVNGQHLGQHRGAYTRFVFDATAALRPGAANEIAVSASNDPEDMKDCLPNASRLYTVWGGLYRKVWLVATNPVHIDPTDFASPGVYITPSNVTGQGADLSVQALVKNAGNTAAAGQVRVTLLDPAGAEVASRTTPWAAQPGQRTTAAAAMHVERPRHWSPSAPNLYHVRTDLLEGGKVVDSVTQPTGFRNLVFDLQGRVSLDGKPIVLAGFDLHQEIESKAAAMSDDDFRYNYAQLKDVGANWVRLPHYPHARLEYDLCDQLGLFCWAEDGHSNKEAPTPTAEQIATEMVKQNYNHPSIAVWSVGNEASADTAEAMVPVVKSLDKTRPVAVANMKASNVDFHAANTYGGWYGGPDWWKFQNKGYVTETGAGGVVTTHCDYAKAWRVIDSWEPEEYQQLVAEARAQVCLHDNDGSLGMFTWWTMRDFTDTKYKKPVGWNTKGLLTYAGDRKDIYYLFRCFLRPEDPTVHITSKRYFLRQGAVDNGVKVYSNAPRLTLTLNGKRVSTLENGKYTQVNGHSVLNVFYWPVPLSTGRNEITASDEAGHADHAVIYFYGANGGPEAAGKPPAVAGLHSANAANPAYFMDMPVQAQWPIYYDLDGHADNSLDAVPKVLEGAGWIATRRVMNPGLSTALDFTLARAGTVYVLCDQGKQAPDYLVKAGFKPTPGEHPIWRGNDLNLGTALLYQKQVRAGEKVDIGTPDRDQLVLVK